MMNIMKNSWRTSRRTGVFLRNTFFVKQQKTREQLFFTSIIYVIEVAEGLMWVYPTSKKKGRSPICLKKRWDLSHRPGFYNWFSNYKNLPVICAFNGMRYITVFCRP